MRYFRATNDAAYAEFRRCLDDSHGYPTPDGVTLDTISAQPNYRDQNGKPILALRDALCVSDCMAGVTEISEQQFFDAMPAIPLP